MLAVGVQCSFQQSADVQRDQKCAHSIVGLPENGRKLRAFDDEGPNKESIESQRRRSALLSRVRGKTLDGNSIFVIFRSRCLISYS